MNQKLNGSYPYSCVPVETSPPNWLFHCFSYLFYSWYNLGQNRLWEIDFIFENHNINHNGSVRIHFPSCPIDHLLQCDLLTFRHFWLLSMGTMLSQIQKILQLGQLLLSQLQASCMLVQDLSRRPSPHMPHNSSSVKKQYPKGAPVTCPWNAHYKMLPPWWMEYKQALCQLRDEDKPLPQ